MLFEKRLFSAKVLPSVIVIKNLSFGASRVTELAGHSTLVSDFDSAQNGVVSAAFGQKSRKTPKNSNSLATKLHFSNSLMLILNCWDFRTSSFNSIWKTRNSVKNQVISYFHFFFSLQFPFESLWCFPIPEPTRKSISITALMKSMSNRQIMNP